MYALARVDPLPPLPFPAIPALLGLLCVLGLGFVGAGVLAFWKASTTTNPLRPESASTLVRRGVYRITRNPMYLGFLILLVGWGIWLSSWTALAVPPLFLLYMNRFQIEPEERALRELFGEDFTRYALSTRRWI